MALATSPSGLQSSVNALTYERISELRDAFDAHPTARLMQNAVTQNDVDDISLDRAVVTQTDHTFSHVLDDWSVTNQQRSGRCWMFAGLNLLRPAVMREMNLKNFEFSQNYTLFWDKLERANYFLELMIATADRDRDDRTVAWLLDRPLDDGGQWNMFVNLIRKHGVVPKSVMPETKSSSNTRRMNSILITKLRKGAGDLRKAVSGGETPESVKEIKEEVISSVHRILSIHLGAPPLRFDWQWNDKDRQFHRDGAMTPLEFADKYVKQPLDEYVCLVHDPRPTSPVGRTFTVEHLGNVVGGGIVKYLNVDIELMKEVARKTILDGNPVWMGCDVAKMMRRDQGIWDAKLYDYDNVYDSDLSMCKSDRLMFHETLMTHAMLFTGVDVGDSQGSQKARRWRVENSWGEDNGRKGFYVMNDSWFDEYMFEIAAHPQYLPESLREAWNQEPIVLPAWDPMGSLAK
ncbi:MAG: C1 family peptidase [Planctomycetes bacterium]|nr:C1 family peptidase [Planctomycetota bacterium]